MSLASEITKANQINSLLNCVRKVTIYNGRIKDDPKYWEIYFVGLDTPIKIESELMDSARSFRRQFLKLTDTPAPPLSASDWFTFVAALSEKAERSAYSEDTDNVYTAERLFEMIQGLPKIKKELVTRVPGYVSHDGFRCIHGYTIEELMESRGYKISKQALSSTLTQLGYKEEGTQAFRVNGRLTRFWFFKEEHFTVSEGDSHE